MLFDEPLSRIALSLVPNIGPVLARKLVSHCGSASAVFHEKKRLLERIQGIGVATASAVNDHRVFWRAEEELGFIEKNKIQTWFFLDNEYPRRLKHCYDAPVILYHIGNTNFNNTRVVGIVGTRRVTPYGADLCEKLIRELEPYNVLVVSGLAYGVDSIAHKTAVECGLQTVGVLAHGLDNLYPNENRGLAKKMIKNGGLLTEYTSNTNPDRENFPSRNRIVAGLLDALIVVESGVEGGSLITVEYAINYNRDVFAFPGAVGEERSAGCNKIIRTHKAGLIESGADLARIMSWELNDIRKPSPQPALPIALDPEEEKIVNSMRGQGNLYLDEISSVSGISMSRAASILLHLEFTGIVKSLPGKLYRLN
ncbi:MAG: DNA processing protein [Bacteroidetes bacterium]|nr:MAG: DNA processing protein [Bacteroidota bacterium]